MPEDLAVVGFDDIEDGRYSTPSLTTIAPDKEAIAEHVGCKFTAMPVSRDDASQMIPGRWAVKPEFEYPLRVFGKCSNYV